MTTATGPTDAREVDLAIEGMTCASCATRIERRLNELDGVTATVNFATEVAHVAFPTDLDPETLVAEVEATGYQAHLPRGAAGAPGAGTADDATEADPTAELRHRLLVSTALTVPVVLMAMIPALQFDHWQWLSLTLAAPVVVWGAWPFHRAAWVNLRHGAATMDTLISLGTLAAFGWSLYALFFGDAGDPGMRMGFDLTLSRGGGADEIYLEVASGVTVLILAGRYFEARAKRRSGAALRALLELGAKDVAVLRDGAEVRIAVDDLAVGDRFVVRPGEKVATDGIVEEGTSAIDASLLTGESVPVEVGPGDPVTGATVNAGGRLVVRATRVGADTALAQIARLVTQAQHGKAPVQRLADRVSAVFVPIVILLASRDARLLARRERGRHRGVHGRGGGAHHRLPVRARPRHAHRAARRHRPRCAARHPHQGPRDPRVHPPGRHDRARQDRHRHHRPHGPGRRRRRRRHRSRRAPAPGRERRGRERAPRRPRRRRRRPGARASTLAPVESFAATARARRAGRGRRARGRRRSDRVPRRLVAPPRPRHGAGARRRRGRRPDRGARRAGTARCAAPSSWPTR